jgi:hypothetical protein
MILTTTILSLSLSLSPHCPPWVTEKRCGGDSEWLSQPEEGLSTPLWNASLLCPVRVKSQGEILLPHLLSCAVSKKKFLVSIPTR